MPKFYPAFLTYIGYRYIVYYVIINFSSKAAQAIYDGAVSKLARTIPVELHPKIRRLFDQISAASVIADLGIPPSNHLKKLKGARSEQWSIRVNKQWRIIFEWMGDNAKNVDVVDYH